MNRQLLVVLAALTAAALSRAHATEPILSVDTTTIPGVPSTAEGSYTFEGAQRQVTTFSTATNTYGVGSVADNVFIRRNGVNANQSSVWYVGYPSGTNLAGTHQDLYGPMLRSNDLLSGSDNTFGNVASAANISHTVGNIERIDFTWNSPITVTNSFAFAVFERGDAGVHDSFAIAAVLAVDASGNPTQFGNILRVGGNWGATNAVANQDYRLFRYGNGDTINASTLNSETSAQGVGGLLITAADLGLTAGAHIYGYALMARDVTATTSTQLLDWTNATYYPTNTDATTGGGGIDLASLNGVAFAVVPEPAALAPILAFAGVFSYSHFRRARRKAAR